MSIKTKLIQTVTVKQIIDEDADTSYFGTFNNEPKTEFAINHGEHSSDRNAFEWFNPNLENYAGLDKETVKSYCEEDYKRAASYGDTWGYVGVMAEARIVIAGTVQTITSGGIWGVESDSGKEYFDELGKEQLSELRAILTELGFSKRAIATSFKSVKTVSL